MHAETRERDPEKLQRIVDAAVAVFSERGFHRATMQEVADAAGIAKGTTYLYFASKEQLLEHIFAVALQEYIGLAERVAAMPAPAPERLRRLIVSTLVGAQSKRGMARFVLEGATGVSAELKGSLLHVHQATLAGIERLVEQGVADGELRRVDARTTAHVINGTISSMAAALLWGDEAEAGAPVDGAADRARARAEHLADQVMAVLDLAPPSRLLPATAEPWRIRP
jgi:TetR/AcrR family fatty acid metabolism transcriptional regulator